MATSTANYQIPTDVLDSLSRITSHKIDNNFGNEIGKNAMGLKFHASAMEINVKDHAGSVGISLNTLDDRMKDLTVECITQFVERKGGFFIEAKMPYGVRQFFFNPVPFALPAVLALNTKPGHVFIEFILLQAPKDVKLYLSFGEIETIRCANCGVHALKMHKCARCKCFRYCSKACQKADRQKHAQVCRVGE
jgi:hypothetical protein